MKRKVLLLVLISIVSIKVVSQVVGTPYIIQNEINKSYILDSISKLPTVAYSVRRVSKTYHGFCMRVRRSSDSKSLDIGFDSNGDLDVSYLLTFVGSSDGFVSVWYDQSNSGRHLTQPTLAYQPKIVISGSLITQNGKPFVAFFAIPSSTSYNHMDVTGGGVSTNAQVIIVNRFGSATGSDGFLLGHTSYFNWHSELGVKLFDGNYASSSVYNGDLYINGILSSTALAPFHSSLKVISLAPQTPGTGTEWSVIGRDRSYHLTSNGGGYSELYSFSTVITPSERQLIENSTIAYFGL